jgi:spermidine synthase
VQPWIRIDAAETPDGTRLELFRRGEDFSIRANGQLLMNTRQHHSEEAFASAALEAVAQRSGLHVLVGGLGCGYTLATTLGQLGPESRVTVAEIVPAVVRWNRELFGALNGNPVTDARVSVFEADICDLFRGSPRGSSERFDVILLDVDNGPRAVARESNGWLYTAAGLAAIHAALTPRGVLAIWSAGPEVGFSPRLREAGFDVVSQRLRSRTERKGQQHLVWLATRRPG